MKNVRADAGGFDDLIADAFFSILQCSDGQYPIPGHVRATEVHFWPLMAVLKVDDYPRTKQNKHIKVLLWFMVTKRRGHVYFCTRMYAGLSKGQETLILREA